MNLTEFLALLLRTGLVLALALGADALLRRTAAVRSFLLRAALAAAVLAALAPLLFPERVRPVVALPTPSVAAAPIAPPVVEPAPERPNPIVAMSAPAPKLAEAAAPAAVPSPPTTPSLPAEWPTILWAGGAALCGLYWAMAHVAVRRLRRRGGAVSGVAHRVLVEVCEAQAAEVPQLRQVPGLASPLACGIFRPCVLLPEAMVLRADRTELTAALAHEVAHLARRDVAWTYATRLVQSLLWFQPLVWGLHRRMVAASEELCDLQAVQGGLRRETYADCLLRLAEDAGRPRLETALGSGMATRRSSLSTRIEALLDARRVRSTRLNRRTRTFVASGVALLAIAGGVFVAVPAVAKSRQERYAIVPGSEAEAQALYKRTRERYAGFKTLSFTVVGAGYPNRDEKFHVKYQRPNRLWIERWPQGTGGARQLLVADGKTVSLYDENSPREIVSGPQANENLRNLATQRLRVTLPDALKMALATPEDQAHEDQAIAASRATFGLSAKDRRTILTRFPYQRSLRHTSMRLDGRGLITETSAQFIQGDRTAEEETEIYSNVRIDEPIPPETFRMVTPVKAKVVAAATVKIRQTPAALALIARIEKASESLMSASLEVVHTDVRPPDNALERVRNFSRKIEFRREGHLRMEEDYNLHWGDVLLVADGKQLWARSEKSRNKVVHQMLSKQDYERTRQMLGSADYRVPENAFNELIELAYVGKALYYSFQSRSAETAPPVKIGGQTMDVLVIRTHFVRSNGAPAEGGIVERIYVDGQGFIHRMERAIDFGRGAHQQQTSEVRNLRVNPELPESRFTFEIPAGYSVISSGSAGRKEIEAKLQPTPQLSPGQTPPTTPLKTLDGRTMRLTSLKGKAVYVLGWTFSVGNYREDLRRAEEMYWKYRKDGLLVIAIGFESGSGREAMAKYVKEKGYTFINVLDSPVNAGPLYNAWNIRRFPFEVVIGRDGIVSSNDTAQAGLEEAIRIALKR